MLQRSREATWQSTGHDGIDRWLLRNNPAGGRTSLVRLRAGTRFPTHRHEGHEEVLVIEGRVRIGEVELERNDYLFTEPGEEHDVVALEDAVIYVASEKPTPPVEPLR
ncbi:MAG: cupin domain-containing protein [Casimicrobiaceae bacterium]